MSDHTGERGPVENHVVMLGSAAGSAEPAPAIEDFRTVRVCPRCRYTIHPGYWHEEQPQPEGASHVVCKLRSANGAILRGPMTEVISKYLDEQAPPSAVNEEES